jgi:uncharacterized LabA/DUF88 family protein
MSMALHAPAPVFRRVMMFIDGGYLREGFKRIYGHDEINFPDLFSLLKNFAFEERRRPEVIRAYYYDAIIDPEQDLGEYKKQKAYFSGIEQNAVFEVKLARLKDTQKGRKQKGVDVKLAVDMITKAFLNHYDIAVFLGGDDDFLDLVKAVKDLTDKRIYGAFYPDEISKELWENLDKRQPLTKNVLDGYAIAKGAKT